MITAAACLFVALYVLCSMRQDFYCAWRHLAAAAAAFYLALWSMPEVAGMLQCGAEAGGVRLLVPFCRSAAVLLVGIVVLIGMRIAVGKLGPCCDPEFPRWLDRPASFAARAVTAVFFALILIESALVLPEAGTFSGFRSTARNADAAALFGSRLLNSLSGRSSFDAKQSKALEEWRESSLREAERIAEREKEERERNAAAAQTQAAVGQPSAGTADSEAIPGNPTGAAPGAGDAAAPGTLLDRTKTRLQRIYDNHDRGMNSSGDAAPDAEAAAQR